MPDPTEDQHAELGEADALAHAEREAEKENDEAWKPTQDRLTEKRREVSKEEAATALDRLLAKAEKYTQFLNVSESNRLYF